MFVLRVCVSMFARMHTSMGSESVPEQVIRAKKQRKEIAEHFYVPSKRAAFKEQCLVLSKIKPKLYFNSVGQDCFFEHDCHLFRACFFAVVVVVVVAAVVAVVVVAVVVVVVVAVVVVVVGGVDSVAIVVAVVAIVVIGVVVVAVVVVR